MSHSLRTLERDESLEYLIENADVSCDFDPDCVEEHAFWVRTWARKQGLHLHEDLGAIILERIEELEALRTDAEADMTFDAASENPEVPGYVIFAQFDPFTTYGSEMQHMVACEVWREEDFGIVQARRVMVPSTRDGLIDLDHLGHLIFAL